MNDNNRRRSAALQARRSRPVEWWVLITQLDIIKAACGSGMAAAWSLVHQGDYDGARARVDDFFAYYPEARTAVERQLPGTT